jgi:hypothetical protein
LKGTLRIIISNKRRLKYLFKMVKRVLVVYGVDVDAVSGWYVRAEHYGNIL